MKKVIIYPGRFQPMLAHHAEVYKKLKSQFPDAEIYVGTSDKVEPPKSPFNFKEKQAIIAAHGISGQNVLMAARPYHKDDYTGYFDENTTIIIFAVGEKDLDRFPFNNVDPNTGLDMTVKGEARPKYYQKINTLKADPRPMSERGYITLAPTIMTGDEVASASAFRQALIDAPDEEAAKAVFQKQFGNYNDKIFKLIYSKITGANMSEQINIMRKLAGLPVAEAAPVAFNAEADAKTAKFLPPSASSAKMSIANRFPKGADVNDLKVKQEQFILALQRSPEALLAEFSERLDPKDDNSLAVGQKLSDIVQLMNQKGGNVSSLPADMKKFVLELTVNAVKNMGLEAGDTSPGYNDSGYDDEDEFRKESVDLSDIRREYGINEDAALVPNKFYVVVSEYGRTKAVAGPFDDEGEAEIEKAEYSEGGRYDAAVAQWTGKDWNFDYMMEGIDGSNHFYAFADLFSHPNEYTHPDPEEAVRLITAQGQDPKVTAQNIINFANSNPDELGNSAVANAVKSLKSQGVAEGSLNENQEWDVYTVVQGNRAELKGSIIAPDENAAIQAVYKDPRTYGYVSRAYAWVPFVKPKGASLPPDIGIIYQKIMNSNLPTNTKNMLTSMITGNHPSGKDSPEQYYKTGKFSPKVQQYIDKISLQGVEEGFASPEQEAKVRARLKQLEDTDPDNMYKIVADEFDMSEEELRDALHDERVEAKNPDEEEDWYNRDGKPDPDGAFDAAGHYYPERDNHYEEGMGDNIDPVVGGPKASMTSKPKATKPKFGYDKAVAANEAVESTTNNAVSAAIAELRKLAGI